MQAFFPLLVLFFILFMIFFAMQKLSYLVRSQVFIFIFTFINSYI